MNKHITTITTHALVLCLWVLPVAAAAQSQCGEGKLCNPLGTDNIWELVSILINDILVGIIAPIVVTLFLLWSGFSFITAQGNKDKLETAKRQFLFVLVGSIILLGAAVILDLVVGTVNDLTS